MVFSKFYDKYQIILQKNQIYITTQKAACQTLNTNFDITLVDTSFLN